MLWNNLTRLPLMSLPERHYIRSDMIYSYSELDRITRISVAHRNRQIKAIHFHTNEDDCPSVYGSAPNDATWTHCPIGVMESIEAIWRASYMSHGCGLVVCSRSFDTSAIKLRHPGGNIAQIGLAMRLHRPSHSKRLLLACDSYDQSRLSWILERSTHSLPGTQPPGSRSVPRADQPFHMGIS